MSDQQPTSVVPPTKDVVLTRFLTEGQTMTLLACGWFSGVVALGAIVGIGSRFFVGESALGGPSPKPATISSNKARIVVGTNAHVSKANAMFPHEECVVAADPGNSARLLIACMYSSEKWGKAKVNGKLMQTRGVAGYYSTDGGETWQRAFEYEGDAQNDFADPALAFGPDGSAYFVCMRSYMKAWEKRTGIPRPHIEDPDSGCLEFSRSPDGGKTWGKVTRVPPSGDRPWIAVDPTLGANRGCLYCLRDLGKSWNVLTCAKGEPAGGFEKVAFPRPPGMNSAHSSNLALLSDGAVVWTVAPGGPDKKAFPLMTVLLSGNGFQDPVGSWSGLRHWGAGSPAHPAESSSFPADRTFASRCFPPRLTATQLRSATDRRASV